MTGRGSERILLLIEWLAEQTEPVTLSEAVTALDLPKSSALGLLRMRRATRNPERQRFRRAKACL